MDGNIKEVMMIKIGINIVLIPRRDDCELRSDKRLLNAQYSPEYPARPFSKAHSRQINSLSSSTRHKALFSSLK